MPVIFPSNSFRTWTPTECSEPPPRSDRTPAGMNEIPDTALPIQPSGVLATIGVLLIIAAHMGTRRSRSLPAA